jgi:hypothetical protein
MKKLFASFILFAALAANAFAANWTYLGQAGSERVYADIASIHFRQTLSTMPRSGSGLEPDSTFTMDISNCIAPTALSSSS